MTLRATLVLLATATTLLAGVELSDHPLAEVKASIKLPAGWTVSESTEDEVFVYRIAKTGDQGAFPITLSVTTHVPDRTQQSPAEYAASLIDLSQDEGSPANVIKGEKGGLKTIRSEYTFDGDDGKMHAVNLAIANDTTGTLYFFAWQAPLGESAETEAVREKIIESAVFDPAF